MSDYDEFYAALNTPPAPAAPPPTAYEAFYAEASPEAQPAWYLEAILCGWDPEDLDHHAATLGQGETVVLVCQEGIVNRIQRSALSPVVYLIRHRSTRLRDTCAMRRAMAQAGLSDAYLP